MADDVNQPEQVAGSPADRERFALWYELHHERILSQCTRMLRDRAAAEDIAHETLLRAWLGRDRMREEDLGAWLSVVARNLCVSHIRKQRRTVPMEVLPETADDLADPAAQLLRKETGRSVRRAMSEVSERHRRLLYLREVNEMEYEELETELGLTPGGTRAVLFRARRMLRHRLAAVGEGLGAWIAGVRVRVTNASNRARVALGGNEAGAAPALQAGMNLALAAGIALSSFSAFGGGVGSVAKPRDVSSAVPRVDAVSGVAAARASGGVAVPSVRAEQGGSGTTHPGQILGKVPTSPVRPPVAKDPETGEEHISIDVGPWHVYDIYGTRYENGPCYTCDTQDKAMTIACYYDPRLCTVD